MDKPEMALAFLLRDGELRPTCCGCSKVLEKRGMIRRVRSIPLPSSNAPPDAFECVFFEIAFPYTIEGCREAIADRHRGPIPWGH
jgi:hypothetical protein